MRTRPFIRRGALIAASLCEKIEFYSHPEPNSGCFLWMGGHTRGYGKLHHKGLRVRAHRAAWWVAHGPIPAGLVVCHKCDVRACINPAHLFLGTQTDNHRDMCQKGRHRNGVYDPAAPRKGVKLTPEVVRSIRQDQRPIRKVAATFGVAYSCVSDIKRRKAWAWLSQ